MIVTIAGGHIHNCVAGYSDLAPAVAVNKDVVYPR
ncbi:hypothetical protein RSAG8_06028, partial [Rhizoctonia solani AG-8 WAC10335]